MRKKAALDLSINSIIVIVLAFAMLGVGIYITNRMRDTGSEGLDKATELIKSIETNPTADNPLVGISDNLDIPANRKLPLGVKFYNKGNEGIVGAKVSIDNCKSTEDGTVINCTSACPLTVVSADEVDIPASDFRGIPFTIKNSKLKSGETYICKFIISNKEGLEAFSKSFFLNIKS